MIRALSLLAVLSLLAACTNDYGGFRYPKKAGTSLEPDAGGPLAHDAGTSDADLDR